MGSGSTRCRVRAAGGLLSSPTAIPPKAPDASHTRRPRRARSDSPSSLPLAPDPLLLFLPYAVLVLLPRLPPSFSPFLSPSTACCTRAAAPPPRNANTPDTPGGSFGEDSWVTDLARRVFTEVVRGLLSGRGRSSECRRRREGGATAAQFLRSPLPLATRRHVPLPSTARCTADPRRAPRTPTERTRAAYAGAVRICGRSGGAFTIDAAVDATAPAACAGAASAAGSWYAPSLTEVQGRRARYVSRFIFARRARPSRDG